MALDFSILEFGNTNPPSVYGHHVIENLFSYVKDLDNLGFKRFWLSEHYTHDFAWSSPEVLLPLLAGSTENIRIGQAGVLLNYHSAFRVAHNFAILSGLFGGRIDLGVVPAGVSPEANKALTGMDTQPGRKIFAERLNDIANLLKGQPLNPDNPDSIVLPLPGAAKPGLWTLGISEASIPLAVKHKTDFCISLFHDGAEFQKQKDVIKIFKQKFYDEYNEIPAGVASIICICSEDREELLRTESNIAKQVQKEGYIIGTPEECLEQFHRLAYDLSLDEIVVNIPGASLERKKNTAQLLGLNVLNPQVLLSEEDFV